MIYLHGYLNVRRFLVLKDLKDMIKQDFMLIYPKDISLFGLKNILNICNGPGLFLTLRIKTLNLKKIYWGYKLKNTNILITGGAGYIGSHIVEQLVNQKNNIIIIDNLVTGYKRLINKKAKFIKADLKNKKNLNNIISRNKIHTIIHLAAYLNVSEAESNKKKYYKNNVIGTKNLVEACKKSEVKNIIYSSSCSVYGKP